MVEKQHTYAIKNLENKIGDKNVSLSFTILKVLNKKVQSNPKYAGVKGTVDTGKTAKDVTTVSKYLNSDIIL